jgi:hypothetical protein
MDIFTKILAWLSLLLGVFIFVASSLKKFSHIGMALAGVSYFLGGVFSLYLNSWLPLMLGFLISFLFRKFFGEPNYAKQKFANDVSYLDWSSKYLPLITSGEPTNYLKVMKVISDMTYEEKKNYMENKVQSKLFWTVIEIGDKKLKILPGRHNGNVVAWWLCQVPYSHDATAIEVELD